MSNIHYDRVLILNFGSQYTQLIARRVREAGVYSEIQPFDMAIQQLKKFNPKAIILSGGPKSVNKLNAFKAPEIIFEMGVPILGICYGMQTMVAQLGGKVKHATLREFGYAKINVQGNSKLLHNIYDATDNKGTGLLDVWMSHGDSVETLPANFTVIAKTNNTPIAGIADETKNFYGLQFHPEVTHTPQGQKILTRFLANIAGCQANWTISNIITQQLVNIQQHVGKAKVLLALSGGVDSSVVAALLHQAIGEQLVCIFVDTGLLRFKEAEEVTQAFAQHLNINVIKIAAEQRFLKKLSHVQDPELKRKIIGKEFITIFEEYANNHKEIKWLAQGTIYPDVIESAGDNSGKTQVIKSHHNVGGLPDIMQLKLLEPLRELFKDEVKKLGIQLGLPKQLIARHPFPGPGLAVRILGEVKKEYVVLLRQADHIFIEELHEQELYDTVSQAFAVFIPVKSVGVMGDNRNYDYIVSLRAVVSDDFMTAQWARLPYEFLAHVANRIINEVDGISRVTYDISGKPPATIEWE